MAALSALALTVAGCACLYLVSPNQRWLARPLPERPLLAAGLVLLVAGVWLWAAALRPVAGMFVALHVAMVCLFAFPYIAAALRIARQGQ